MFLFYLYYTGYQYCHEKLYEKPIISINNGRYRSSQTQKPPHAVGGKQTDQFVNIFCHECRTVSLT